MKASESDSGLARDSSGSDPGLAWDRVACVPQLPADVIQVWRADLSALTPHRELLERCLHHDDHARAARLTRRAVRDRFVLVHGLLRALLGGYLRQRPESIEISVEPGGKPVLAHPAGVHALGWNVSHSGGATLFAFAWNLWVGIDVEDLRREVPTVELSRRFFHPDETRAIESVPVDRRAAVFFRHWTAKEAVLKATGVGLAGSLSGCRVEWSPEATATTVRLDQGADSSLWLVEYLEPYPSSLAAVTADGIGWTLRCFDCSPELIGRLVSAAD